MASAGHLSALIPYIFVSVSESLVWADSAGYVVLLFLNTLEIREGFL